MAWIEKSRNKWAIKDRNVHGKRFTVATVSKENKKAFLEKYERDKELRDLNLLNPYRTLQEAIDEYALEIEKVRAFKTHQIVVDSLSKFLKFVSDKPLISINSQDIQGWKIDLLKRYKLGMVGICMRTVKTFFNCLADRRILGSNPFAGIQIPLYEPSARFLTNEEVEKLLEACTPGIKNIVQFALHTGMRRGEIINARVEHLKDGFLTIPKTKTGFPRIIPLHPIIFENLTCENGALFEGYDIWRLEREFRRAVQRAQIGRVRFHDLRHTFCSNYLSHGGTIADLREISGHRSLVSLQVYAHFQQSHLKERINLVNYDAGQMQGKTKEINGFKVFHSIAHSFNKS